MELTASRDSVRARRRREESVRARGELWNAAASCKKLVSRELKISIAGDEKVQAADPFGY